jgi:uncharacterized membrane protein
MPPSADTVLPGSYRRVPAALAMYAVAVAGLGVLLVFGWFATIWVPIPKWVPGRSALTSAGGAILLIFAIGLSWRKTVVRSSAILALFFSTWLLLLQVPRIVSAPSKEGLWAGAGQLATLVTAAWVLFALLSPKSEVQKSWLGGDRGARLACSLYAVALPLFGIHHFVDPAGTAEAVPAWLPFRMALGYATGVGHVAAGVAIFFRIVPRLAATLEAIMISAFVLLIHLPGVVDAPRDSLQWTMFAAASAIGGAAWIVARCGGDFR